MIAEEFKKELRSSFFASLQFLTFCVLAIGSFLMGAFAIFSFANDELMNATEAAAYCFLMTWAFFFIVNRDPWGQ